MAQSAAPKHESPRRATYQDVLDAPAHLVAEIINGTLHTHPRPASRHALATSNLGDELVSPFGKGVILRTKLAMTPWTFNRRCRLL